VREQTKKKMIQIIGYVGILIVVLAFVILNTKYSSWFLGLDALGTLLLFIYALIQHDLVFVISQLFILVLIAVKLTIGGIK
jgi:lipid-A-disaccharide synthase-like uncharacterized protein